MNSHSINLEDRPDRPKPVHMKSKNNIWTKGWGNWKYPINWFDNIKHIFRVTKWAYQRAVRGYSDWDVWDLDIFYKNLFAESIDYLRQTTHGFPGREGAATEEEWDEILRNISEKFYRSEESNEYYKSDAWDRYYESKKDDLFSKDTPEQAEMHDLWFNQERGNELARQKDFEEAMRELTRWFGDLWD